MTILEEPHLGIYWLIQSKVEAFRTPMSEVSPLAGFRDVDLGHADLWPRVVARHPELRSLDYFEIPRGRVLYVEDEGIFRVFMPSREAKKEPQIQLLIAAFVLPPLQVRICQDRHYEPPRSDLFGRSSRRSSRKPR